MDRVILATDASKVTSVNRKRPGIPRQIRGFLFALSLSEVVFVLGYVREDNRMKPIFHSLLVLVRSL